MLEGRELLDSLDCLEILHYKSASAEEKGLLNCGVNYVPHGNVDSNDGSCDVC